MLSHRVCTIRYAPPQATPKTIRATLRHDWIKKLDNFPIGFESIRETALFDFHSVNVLDIDSNRWENIQVNSIIDFIVPGDDYGY
jgi:hypothetical protein